MEKPGKVEGFCQKYPILPQKIGFNLWKNLQFSDHFFLQKRYKCGQKVVRGFSLCQNLGGFSLWKNLLPRFNKNKCGHKIGFSLCQNCPNLQNIRGFSLWKNLLASQIIRFQPMEKPSFSRSFSYFFKASRSISHLLRLVFSLIRSILLASSKYNPNSI